MKKISFELKKIITLALTAFGLLALSSGAQAQYPNKPIKMIIGYTAGGAADKLIRPIAERA